MTREFIYYSERARTVGNFGDDLMKAGRIDIACQIVIMSFFVSHKLRQNVRLHLLFNGPPDAPKHMELYPGKALAENSDHDISKKDVAGLIKRLLYKYKPGINNEVMPGYFIEKKGIIELVNNMIDSGKEVFILDKRGEDIRDIKIGKNPVFILGDHDGIPKDEMKRLKKLDIKKVSIGNEMYFASQTMTIVQNELDRRGIE
jgi:tRNA (pseudouridine54-N1)-methyltransferase